MSQPLSTTVARVADLARRTLSALWPRGTASYETSRLLEAGYASGAQCDLAFSIGFADPSMAAAATTALRAARYVVDTAQLERGFLTVQENVRLRAFDLALAIARLERVVAGYDGFVAPIGPTRPAPGAVTRPDDARADDAMTTRGRLVA